MLPVIISPCKDRNHPLNPCRLTLCLDCPLGGELPTCPLSSGALFQPQVACNPLSIRLSSHFQRNQKRTPHLSTPPLLFLRNAYVRTQGRPPQNTPQWHADYSEFRLLDPQLVQEGQACWPSLSPCIYNLNLPWERCLPCSRGTER